MTLKVKGAAGTKVHLRFAEILNPDGSIYTANLRNADATDTYILKGGVDLAAVPVNFDLYREGIIDSFGMLEMIMALEVKFGATLDYMNMSPEDLTNIDKLAAYVASSCASRPQQN